MFFTLVGNLVYKKLLCPNQHWQICLPSQMLRQWTACVHILEPRIEFRGLKWGIENNRLWSEIRYRFQDFLGDTPPTKLCGISPPGNTENLSYSVNYQTKDFTFPPMP